MPEHDRDDDGYTGRHFAGGVVPGTGPEHSLREALTHVDREGRLEPNWKQIQPDRLERMIRRQLELQKVGRSLDPPSMTGEERGWFAVWNHTALIKELGEALDEVAWKPWSVDKDTFNRDQFIAELVDAWHFLMNLLLLAGSVWNIPDDMMASYLSDEFYKRYIDKSAENMRRWESGTYDSKSTKCPDCGREVRDQIRVPMKDRIEIREETWQDEHGYQGDVGRIEYEAYQCPMQCGRVNYVPATG